MVHFSYSHVPSSKNERMWRGMSFVNFPSWWREVNKDGVHKLCQPRSKVLGVLCARNKTCYLRVSYHWSAFAKPLLLWKSNENNMFQVWVCSLSYAKRMRHIVIRGLSGCNHIFAHGTTSGKTLLNVKFVFWFSVQLLCETFLIRIRIQRDIMNVHRSSCKVPIIRVRF